MTRRCSLLLRQCGRAGASGGDGRQGQWCRRPAGKRQREDEAEQQREGETEETRERRESVGAADGGWFAAAPGLCDGEGLLHFAARAAAAARSSTGVILFFKMKMQHALHELLETV
jgi:hypothetical protein